MSETAVDEKRIRDEAAGWYARLNNTTISTDMLREFREWRKGDGCDEAYLEIEDFWRRAAKLKDDEEIKRAAEEALARKKTLIGPLPRPGGRTLAGAAFIALLAAAIYLLSPPFTGRTYSTDVGEQRYVRLDDGSRVRLDTASKVRVRLKASRRDVELVRGQAFFEVAHDASSPFVVRADGTEVRALGTRFSVRRDDDAVQVTLVEGKVRIDEAGRPALTLAPGDQVAVGETGTRSAVRKVDTASATSWTDGRLVFRSRPLAQAINEVNRYSPRKVVLDAPALANTPVSGVFDIGDTDAFVAAVGDLYGLKALRSERAITLHPAA